MRKMTWLVATMMAALVGCGGDNATKTADQAPKQGGETAVLRVATEGAYAPFNYTNPDGSLGGFDVDIANALCAEMKMTCDIKPQDWDGIIPALKMGKYDAIIAAMSVTEERSQQLDFSQPYFVNSLVFLAKEGSAFDPSNEADINRASIAAQRSTISSQWLQKTYPNSKPQLYDTLNNAFLDLAAGRAEAMIADKVPALDWLKGDSAKGFVIKGDEIDINDHIAVAVDKGNGELLGKINTALETIKANGEYDKIVAKHFGSVAK